MIKTFNSKSIVYGISGLIVLVVVNCLHGLIVKNLGNVIGHVLCAIGDFLFFIGCSYYAKAKGYSGYLGILGPFGLIILAFLKDKNANNISGLKDSRFSEMILLFVLLLLGILFASGF